LINNAAILGAQNLIHESVLKVPESEFTSLFDVNVCGVLRVTNTFFPLFKNKEVKPVVLNISSDMSSISMVPDLKPGHVAYKVSKCALNMLTKNYAIEFGKDVTFVCMHPGWLDTG
jgi:NAD(P)-dependent dehydrogenase (short-subunit alcohol dehydrogenase family)